jgi:hypothetical protein
VAGADELLGEKDLGKIGLGRGIHLLRALLGNGLDGDRK